MNTARAERDGTLFSNFAKCFFVFITRFSAAFFPTRLFHKLRISSERLTSRTTNSLQRSKLYTNDFYHHHHTTHSTVNVSFRHRRCWSSSISWNYFERRFSRRPGLFDCCWWWRWNVDCKFPHGKVAKCTVIFTSGKLTRMNFWEFKSSTIQPTTSTWENHCCYQFLIELNVDDLNEHFRN